MLGPREKAKRAKRHFDELQGVIGLFFQSRPYEVAPKDYPEKGQRIYEVVKAEDPPIDIALIAGDVIHNLRSALDLLYWQLVEAAGNTPNRDDTFPICGTAKIFEATARPKVERRISKDALDVLRSVKPYKGGHDGLWRLHHLDIADKHRVLFVVGSAYRSVSLPFPDTGDIPEDFREAMIEASRQVHIRPADRLFPLKEGDELLGVPLDGKLYKDPQFTFEVAFGEGEIVEGEPITPTLIEFGTATHEVIELFAPLL